MYSVHVFVVKPRSRKSVFYASKSLVKAVTQARIRAECCTKHVTTFQARCRSLFGFFFFSSRRRHTRCGRDWSSDVCSSDLDVKEPLDLRLVQIHRQHAVRARGAQDVGDELRRNRDPRLVLAVLARVAVIRNHRRDARRRRAAERLDHHQHLHDVLVDRRARRLDDEPVGAANVLVDLERDFRIGEPAQPRLTDLDAKERRDLPRELWMRAAREHLQLSEPGRHERFTNYYLQQPSHSGWGGRIRTFEYGIQSPAPYRLATPHCLLRESLLP